MAIFNSYVSLPEGTTLRFLLNVARDRLWLRPKGKAGAAIVPISWVSWDLVENKTKQDNMNGQYSIVMKKL